MTNRFIVYERYQAYWSDGIRWTEWFMVPMSKFFTEENEAKAELKKLKQQTSAIDKATKMKHEFEVRKIDVETLPPPKVHYSKKGRPTKEEIAEKEAAAAKYWLTR